MMTRSGSTYSSPGKVFVLGEYAVLAAQPALVATMGPRFEMGLDPGRGASELHPQSPAARLLDWARRAGYGQLPMLRFTDPFRGAGGFGASTAQFALAYRALAEPRDWPRDWNAIWKLYRELSRGQSALATPSGADLVAQWEGGVTLFAPFEKSDIEDLWGNFDWSGLLVFSATDQSGRKVATHEHLDRFGATDVATVSARWVLALQGPLRDGIAAARAGDPVGLGRAMDEYAEGLRECGLEIEATRDDLRALRPLRHVLGAKGAGAMQADAVLLLVDPAAPAESRREIIRSAELRGLRLLCDGLTYQSGVK